MVAKLRCAENSLFLTENTWRWHIHGGPVPGWESSGLPVVVRPPLCTGHCPVFSPGPTRVTSPQLCKCKFMGTRTKSPALLHMASLSSLFQWHIASLKENHGDEFHPATNLSPRPPLQSASSCCFRRCFQELRCFSKF